jgi:hypothetical protein
MRALTSLDISSNQIGNGVAGQALGGMLKINTTLKTLNVSYNVFRFGSATEEGTQRALAFAEGIAAGLAGNGALSLANVMGNRIGKEMLSKLQEIMRSKPNLISLCGIADDATEVSLSGLSMDADDAVILVSELPDKRAMTSLNLASNDFGVEGAKFIAAVLPKCT